MEKEQIDIALAVVTASSAGGAGGYAALTGAAIAWLAMKLNHQGRASLRVSKFEPTDENAAGLAARLRRAGAIQLVEAAGALLFTSVPRIDLMLPEGPPWPSYLIVDLRRVTTIDGSALSALSHVLDCLETRDGRFALVCAPAPSLLRSLEAAGVLRRALGGVACFTIQHALERIAECDEEATHQEVRLASSAYERH